ncbi:MAG: Gfo/Idh/MocA family oxidoreductase [Spirochaetes bacterium]|nr:Gfo/Idh/MocA family oxidoreductase [Spirochaetota bacterium]
MNFGIIGCGGIADRKTIPGMLKSHKAKITAVEGRSPGKTKQIARKYNIPKYYTTVDELVNDKEVDAVYIGTPVYLHREQIITAADAGKHILSEKPLGMNVQETEEITAYCDKKNVILQVGFMMRYHGYHIKAKEMLKNGELGQPVMGRAQLTCWYPPTRGAWRQNPEKGGGGALMDMAIHSVDILRYMFGKVKEVSSFNGTITHDYPVEDSGIILLRFDDGIYGICDSFFNIPDEAAKGILELYGTGGSLMAEGTISQAAGGRMVAYIQKENKGYDAQQNRQGITPKDIRADLKDLYQSEVEDFIDAIENNRKPMNSGEESLINIKVIEAAYESQKSGKTIRI